MPSAGCFFWYHITIAVLVPSLEMCLHGVIGGRLFYFYFYFHNVYGVFIVTEQYFGGSFIRTQP
jgi:hypothetical protein